MPKTAVVRKFVAPTFSEKVDELGRAMAQASPLNKRIDQLKKELKLNPGLGRIRGKLFEANIYEEGFVFLSAEKARLILSKKQLALIEQKGKKVICDVHALTAL